MHERPLHKQCFTVWCTVTDFDIAHSPCIPATCNRGFSKMALQRILRLDAVGLVSELFSSYLISLRVDIPRPARSLNLIACDFLFWGHLKVKFTHLNPNTIDQLKAVIWMEITALSPEWPTKVMINFRVNFTSLWTVKINCQWIDLEIN